METSTAVPTPEQRPFLDARDIAPILGFSERTVSRMMSDNTWPEMFWLRNRRVVPTAAFRRWAGIDQQGG